MAPARIGEVMVGKMIPFAIAFVHYAEEQLSEQQEAKNNCAIRAGKTRQESYEQYHYKVAQCMKSAEDNI